METPMTNIDDEQQPVDDSRHFKKALTEILARDGEDPNLLPRSAITKITDRLCNQLGDNRFGAFVSAYQKDHYELNRTVSYLVGLRSVAMIMYVLKGLEFDTATGFQDVVYHSLLDVENAIRARQYNTRDLYAAALKIGKSSSTS